MEQFCKAVVPNFLHKLWSLVDDAVFDHVIRWNKDGHSFQIVNEGIFSKEVLPKYFKHGNLSSFIRQLNIYGFRKVITFQSEKTSQENKVCLEFQHPLFKKGGTYLLEHIKRKGPTMKNEDVRNYPQEFQKILTEVQVLRNKQSNMDAKFEKLKQEYTDILLEITNLRKKYCDQQQLLTQVLQFVLELISGSNTEIKKRKRSFPSLPGTSDSECEHQHVHIPEDKKKEAMDILKDGYALIEGKYKSLLDNAFPVLEDDSNNVIPSINQPSGDDEKVSQVSSQDIPMNEDSLISPLDLNIPFLEEQFIEEFFEQEPKNISLELESSKDSDSILTENKSDTNCNSVMNRDEMHIHCTDGNLIDWSVLSRKNVNYDFDQVSEPVCYELPTSMTNKTDTLLNMDVMEETNSLSLMKNEREQSLLEANEEKDKHVVQYMEKSLLSLFDEVPMCDFEEKFQDSNDLPLDELNKPPNVSSALGDHDYITLDIASPQEVVSTTIENFVPQLCLETSVDSTEFPMLFLNPVTNVF